MVMYGSIDLDFDKPSTIFRFMEERCGIGREQSKIVYESNGDLDIIRISVNGSRIVDASDYKLARTQLMRYYQETCIKQFLPDALRDLQLSLRHKKVCKGTIQWLHDMARSLEENYELINE